MNYGFLKSLSPYTELHPAIAPTHPHSTMRMTSEAFRAWTWHIHPSSLNLAGKWDPFLQKIVNKHKSQLASNLTWIHRKFIEFYITETLEMS